MPTPWVDYKAIKAHPGLMGQIVEHYALTHSAQTKKDEVKIRCPFHDDEKPSCNINTEKNIYHCFSCGASGNVIDLVAHLEGVEFRAAALLIQERFLTAAPPQPPARPSPPDEREILEVQEIEVIEEPAAERAREEAGSPINPPLQFALKHLDPDHPYLTETRGLTQETIAHFGLGYHAGKGIMHGRCVIPIHNEQGALVAYAGRWPGDDPPAGEGKYKLPPHFQKSLMLYNLHRCTAPRESGLILVEGFFDVMRLWQSGVENAVAIMGSALSQHQEQFVVETLGPRGHVTLAFDNDEAGKKCTDDALARLARQLFVTVAPR